MSLSYTEKLGKTVGDIANRSSETERNIEGDDTSSSFNFEFFHPIKLSLGIRLIKYNLPIDGFVMDHPIYGDLNNGAYRLNIGYGGFTPGSFTFPATFPITFTGGVALAETELIYEDNF